MDGAIVVLAVNIAVGAMFVFGHAISAAANRDQRAARAQQLVPAPQRRRGVPRLN